MGEADCRRRGDVVARQVTTGDEMPSVWWRSGASTTGVILISAGYGSCDSSSSFPVEVRACRMEADLLDRLPTQPLTDNDRVGLRAWRADRTAPVRELAQALLTTGRKAEQEGRFLLHRRG